MFLFFFNLPIFFSNIMIPITLVFICVLATVCNQVPFLAPFSQQKNDAHDTLKYILGGGVCQV